MGTLRRVGIIGAGMSGLMAAVYLARQGHDVYVFDRAKYPGGTSGYYVRNGVQYPTGATITFGMERGGPLRRLLESVEVPFKTTFTHHSMDVVLPDRVVHIYSDREAWFGELRRAFPERAEAVVHFWHHVERTADTVYDVSKAFVGLPIRSLTDWGKLPTTILRHPTPFIRLIPETRKTVEDTLIRYGLEDYAPLRRFLDAQLVDAAQTDCSSAAWLPASIALDIYRKGVHLVTGGLPSLMQSCMEKAMEYGAHVLLSRTVQKATYHRHKRRWILTTNHRESFDFDFVINATGTTIPGDAEELQHSAHGTLSTDGTPYTDGTLYTDGTPTTGWGALRLDGVVSAEWTRGLDLPVDTNVQPFAVQIANDEQIGQLLKDKDGAIYVTIHPLEEHQRATSAAPFSSRDVNVNHEQNLHVISVSVHTPAEDWLSLSKEAYEHQKSIVTEAIVERVSNVLKGYREAVQNLRVGSPKTYERYLKKPLVGGAALTVENSISRPVGPRTSLPGWFLAGDSVFPGPGTLSSAMSGFFAARCIDRRVMRRLNG